MIHGPPPFPVNMDVSSRVFFFIRDSENSSGEVLIPDMAQLGVGDYNRPTVVRSKSSFFRSYNGRSNSLRIRVRTNLRRKTAGHDKKDTPFMSYKPKLAEPAWWQQTSTDVSSDHETETDLEMSL